MSIRPCFAALVLFPGLLVAQQPDDSLVQHRDSLAHATQRLKEITVTSTPVRRDEPSASIQISAADYLRAPAINPYEALRQTAGLEVHDQGQHQCGRTVYPVR